MSSERVTVTEDEINAWMRRLYALSKIHTVRLRDDVLGLVRVPAKYVAIIDAMHQAMTALAHGDPLPEFEEEKRNAKKR